MMEKTLIDFLKYIYDNHTDQYGHLQVCISEDENVKKVYYNETPEAIVKDFLNQKSYLDKEFAEWLGKNNYSLVQIYAKYLREDDTREVYPDYDTFVAEKWSTHTDMDEIMVDNDNTELEWCLNNSFTTQELYEKFLSSNNKK